MTDSSWSGPLAAYTHRPIEMADNKAPSDHASRALGRRVDPADAGEVTGSEREDRPSSANARSPAD